MFVDEVYMYNSLKWTDVFLSYHDALLTRWDRWKEAQCLPHGDQCLVCWKTCQSIKLLLHYMAGPRLRDPRPVLSTT